LGGAAGKNIKKEKETMKKRLFSIFLALTMALSLIPTMAMAEGDEPADPNAAETLPQEEALLTPAPVPAAATDGYTEWTSTDSLPTSGTYRLTTDVTIKPTFSKYATVTKSLVLDLAGHIVTVSDEEDGKYAYFVNSSNASLVIEDSVGGGKITNARTSDSMLTLIQVNSGSFELKGGTLENTSSMGYALHLNSSSTATLSGGTVVNTASGGHAAFVNSSAQLTMTNGEIKNTANGGYAVYVNGNAGTFTMDGGKVTQESTYSSSAAIYANNSATSVSISGGEVVSNSMGVYAAFTPVSVTGGTFQTESYAFQTRHATIDPADGNTVSVTSGGAVFYTFSESENKIVDGDFTASALTKSYTQDPASTLTVSGGTFDIENVVASAGDNSKITISGGTFEKNVPDLGQYLGKDKEIQIQPDGSLIVGESSGETPAAPVSVTINGGEANFFDTLAAAIEEVNKASAGASITVSLGKDQIVTETIRINKGLNVTLDLGGKTLLGPDSGYTIQFGSFDKGTATKPEDCEYTNSGTLTLTNGAVIGYRGILNYFGNVVLDQGLTMTTTERVVNTYGGKITVQGAKLKSTTAFGVVLFNSFYPFNFDASPAVTNSKDEKNKSAEFVMTSGSIDVVYYPVSGNNQRSAGTKATITGGTLTASEEYTAIYWPMEGELTVGGDAVITGGTGIEAKMGTITIRENAQVIGTAAYKADEPTNGGSSPDGSALLLSAQMYGGVTSEYQTDNQLKVSISGGTLTSQNGNAVTVYNTEQNEVQTAQITVSGGTFTAEKAAIISVTKGGNTVTTDGNTQTTSKSKTTLTVSGSVAPASIDANGKTAYYTDVTKAIQSVNQGADTATQITVFGNTTISTDVVLQENIILVVTPGTQLSADVTSGESNKVVVTEKDSKGNTVYKLVETPTNPEQTYVASITTNGQTAYFQTLEDAVKTVQDGQTITLLKNSDAVGAITISRAVTFTLDLKTFTMKDTIAAGSGFVLTRNGNTYTVSVYVPPVTPPQPDDRPSGGSSSGGSSSSDGDYTVSVDTGKHGTVTVSPKRADKGDTVTITVKPDKGYELDELTVTDKNGDTVKLKDKGNGKFSFTMPGSKVTVEAKFVKERAAALPFADVSADHWAYDEIAWAYENGYMNGTSAAAFNPGGSVSRQQLWMILARLSGASPATMAEAREWAIGNGVSDGSNPGGAISRQQMVAILYRYAKLMGYDTTGAADLTAFPDHASVADYAKEAMAWSVKNEIVGGTAQGTLNPAGTASRAQFAVILYRFVK
jgi:hypothetical protein